MEFRFRILKMLSKRTGGAVIASLSIAFLLATPVFAVSKPSNLNLVLAGTFVDIGSQRLQQSGGMLVGLSIFGSTLNPTTAQIQYKIDASVRGTMVSGNAHFSVIGKTTAGEDVSISGDAALTGMVPAFGTPLPTPLTPASDLNSCMLTLTCTSQVPAYLTGIASVEITTSGQSDTNGNSYDGDKSNSNTNTGTDTKLSVLMLFESAYMNPFGGPISITTAADSSIVIVATYTKAISHWENVVTGGAIFDNTGEVGAFSIMASLTEGLLAATEQDTGTIALSSQSFSYLNAAGEFKGTSTIPTAGSFDCSSTIGGLPLPGTCTATGSISEGKLSVVSTDGKSKIKGAYFTEWTVPAVAFTSAITATLKQE